MKAKVELIIGDPLVPPSFKSQFELVIGYMHGDADGDTSRTLRYRIEDEDELKEDLAALMYCEDLDDTDMQDYFRDQGIENPENAAAAFSDSFWEGDITCEGNAAQITDIDLYYYDANGIKHEVEAKVNGKRV